MKIRIGDRELKFVAPVEFPLHILLEMEDSYGYTVEKLSADLEPFYSMQAESEKATSPDDQRRLVLAFLSNTTALRAFAMYIWALRRRDGEQLTLAQASDLELSTLQLVPEDGDERPAAPTPDPRQARPGSAPGAGGHNRAARRRRSRSKTSGNPSTGQSGSSPRSPQPST